MALCGTEDEEGHSNHLNTPKVEDSELLAAEGEEDALDEEGPGQGDAEGAVSSTVTVLHYRPISLGAARLPGYLQDEIMVPLFSKQAFVNQVGRPLLRSHMFIPRY